jgi:PEP-CTERM motif
MMICVLLPVAGVCQPLTMAKVAARVAAAGRRGNLDELWVFNRPLTATEVASLRLSNSISAVPEPTSLAMLGVAAAGASLQLRRRQR